MDGPGRIGGSPVGKNDVQRLVMKEHEPVGKLLVDVAVRRIDGRRQEHHSPLLARQSSGNTEEEHEHCGDAVTPLDFHHYDDSLSLIDGWIPGLLASSVYAAVAVLVFLALELMLGILL